MTVVFCMAFFPAREVPSPAREVLSGSLNNEFSHQENQTGEMPSDEVIRNRRR